MKALDDRGVRSSLLTSLPGGSRRRSSRSYSDHCCLRRPSIRFFGRDTISFIVILDRLPGIVTGIALNTAFRTDRLRSRAHDDHHRPRRSASWSSCNPLSIARLRRTATIDRGGVHGPRRRHGTDVPSRDAPAIGTSLVAGALLAIALSFDEIIVTTFTSGAGTQTLPIWIFSNYQRTGQVPLVNVAAVIVLALGHSVYLAQLVSARAGGVAGGRTDRRHQRQAGHRQGQPRWAAGRRGTDGCAAT